MNTISGRNRTFMSTALLASGVCLSILTSSAFADDFAVNEVTDAVDVVPGDGVCEVTAAAGDCSLRAAIMEANALTGADTIAVPAGTYTLTIEGVDEHCETTGTACTGNGTVADPYLPEITSDASIGDLDITDDVTITGAGSDLTRIEWATATPDSNPLTGDRIFHVAVASGATANIASVIIEGLTVVNGETGVEATVAADVCIDDGTGTLIYTPANLNAYDIDDNNATDTDCNNHTIVIDQFRRMGGAIALGAGYAVVTYDEANTGSPGDLSGPFPGGKPGEEEGYGIDSVSLNDVVVVNSWSGADGGGIYSAVASAINSSKISGNTSHANGGGIYNDAALTITDTLIGMVFDADTVTAHPELANPNMAENGGGMFDTGSHTTTINSSAINGNEAIGGGGIAGRAGITINITNTTVSGNTGIDVGGGITTNGTINLTNVTVADNQATTDAPGGGAGLNSFGGGSFNINNTLLTNNIVTGRDIPMANCGCSGGAATCPAGRMESEGFNLESGDTCDFNIALSDQINTDPLLVALADNGGPTETHLIPHSAVSGTVDSPAVDAANDITCPNNDQRNGLRPADGNGDSTAECDIGAFELSTITPDLQIANMVAPNAVYINRNFIVTTTIYNGSVNPDSIVELVTDTLPAEVEFVSATATGGSVNSCTEATGIVTCSVGDLGGTASATATLTLKAIAFGDATVAVSLTSSNEPDALDLNNSASTTTKVIAVPDDNGGFCSYHPNGRFDPILPLIVLSGFAYLMFRRRA